MKSSRTVGRWCRQIKERRFANRRERTYQSQELAGEGSDQGGNSTWCIYPHRAFENFGRPLCLAHCISADGRKMVQKKSENASPESDCMPVPYHWQVALNARISTEAAASSISESESVLNNPMASKAILSVETRDVKCLYAGNSLPEQDAYNGTIVERDESMVKDSHLVNDTQGETKSGIVSNIEAVQSDIQVLQLEKRCALAIDDMCRLEVAFNPQLEGSQTFEKEKHVEGEMTERSLYCPKTLKEPERFSLANFQEPTTFVDATLALPLSMDKDESQLVVKEVLCIDLDETRKSGKEDTERVESREREKGTEHSNETNMGQDRGKCLEQRMLVTKKHEQGLQSLTGNANPVIVSTKANLGSNIKNQPYGGQALPATSQESHIKVQAPVRHYDKLYIILDLNGVLIKRWKKRPLKAGLVKENKNWIQFRPGCVEFLRRTFLFFHVGIWSSMKHANVIKVCSFLEEEAHQRLPFFMIWSEDKCLRYKGIVRPDKAHVVADFKPLSHVCEYFHPYAGFHNTILIDDSPYKACMNNPNNCIFPEPFEGSDDDNYLNDVLWPYLERMAQAPDIRVFIADCRIGQLPVTIGHDLYGHLLPVIQKLQDPIFHLLEK